MAMDREKLLIFFQTHYLSRQEVLFKLPLNVSIDAFWPELLSRRKAKATVLPLNNAAGMPYWYVLTDRMVAASERLCEEALAQDMAFDPYRAGMTSAMTEEMFFTSFVEGAQIPLQEAMDFLQRGTEPESIHEQMIWNNRHAWAEMVGMLYRPLDEGFVRSMAFMLTEEMDNCAEDYRQTDQHPIAAMNNESYELPPAYSLPDRMSEYYNFLQKPDVHPLIKAAVAQAYLLVTRPFPEGNERLSRMMSAAVLLRCGYDFFRDISISAVIAKESYRYYKCMCEIIRSENGGDLTYFIEYFLELLVRALDIRWERQRRREQDSLEREREMARHPLESEDGKGTQLIRNSAEIPQAPPADVQPATDSEEEETQPVETEPRRRRIIPPLPLMSVEDYLGKINKLRYSPNAQSREMPVKVRMMLEAGYTSFSTRQWGDITECDVKQADYDCRFLFEKGLADRERRDKRFVYSLRIIAGDDKTLIQEGESPAPFDMTPATVEPETVVGESPPGEGFYQTLERMENSKSEHVRKTAATVREMLAKGITQFSRSDWADMSGMEWKRMCDACDYLVQHKLVVNMSGHRNRSEYVFTLPENEPEQKKNANVEAPVVAPDDEYSPVLLARLREMAADKSSARNQRIGTFVLDILDRGIERFTVEDWVNAFHLTKPVYTNDLRRAVNLGLLRKKNACGQSTYCTYEVPTGPYQDVRCSDLTKTQCNLLGRIYSHFKKNEFTVHEGAVAIGCSETSFDFHLTNFAERGIMTVHKHPEYPGHAQGYSLAILPKDYPECFRRETHHNAASGGTGYAAERVPLAAASA